ncbi:MAG: ATP-binding protein [Phycisphaerae bacterium]
MPGKKEKEERLILRIGQEQVVHMKVAAQIVQHLSKGIYSNPANCIKELINNSFDADATKVTVRARPEFDTFSITDDGEGMNYKDFDKKFLWISRSDKRDSGLLTSSGRPKIGKIGIGFIAVSEICNKMTVISSRKGEAFKFQADINFGKFKATISKKRDFYELSEVKLVNLREEEGAHYTIILLSELGEDFRELLEDKDILDAGIKIATFDGLKFEKIVERIEDRKLNLWKGVGGYWRLMIEVANTVPVVYLEEGPIRVRHGAVKKKKLKEIQAIKDKIKGFNFIVDFDGVMLRKPIQLPIEEDILEDPKSFDIYTFREKFNDFGDKSILRFRGYVYSQRRQILPAQLRGIIVRIKNTAIGSTDPDFLGYPYAEKLFLPWTFGEIYVEDGLEEAMNVNRNSFIVTHPHYRRLKNYLHNILHTKVFPTCRIRYVERKEASKKEEETSRKDRMKDYLKFVFERNFSVTSSKESSEVPVEIDMKKRRLVVYPSHPIFRKRKKKERTIIEEVLVLFEASCRNAHGDLNKMREYFFNSLKKW